MEQGEATTVPAATTDASAVDQTSASTSAEDMATGPPPRTEFYSLEVLHTIKTAQMQHGLRHEDHQRYRQYCTRRLRRVRKSLHFKHGKGKYVKKSINHRYANDPRFLLIPLYSAERAWSYAMEKKEDAENPRAKFGMGARLKKAQHWAAELLSLCNHIADDKTKLEAEAYSAWMSANFLLYHEQWADARDKFSLARRIYDQLGVVGHVEQQEEFKQRVREIDPSIRFCTYNLNVAGGAGDQESTLSELRGDAHNAASAVLQAQLDKVMADVRKKQSETMREISWGGKTISVKADKAREHILAAQEQIFEIEKTNNIDAKVPLYDHLLYCYTEALNAIRDDIRASQAKPQFADKKNVKQEVHEENLKPLTAYVTYQKVWRSIERDLLLAHSLATQLDPLSGSTEAEKVSAEKEKTQEKEGESDSTTVSQSARSGRTPKAKEIVKLYDVVLQNLEEVQRLRIEDVFSKECAALKLGLVAFRAYFVGLWYVQGSKWHEAINIFHRVERHVDAAAAHLKALPSSNNSLTLRIPPDTPLATALAQFKANARAKSYAAQAQALLAALPGATTPTASQASAAGTGQSVALVDALDSYEGGARAVEQGRLIDFPPTLIPVAAKPILFDLALDAITFPDLESRKKAKSFFRFW
eukprot:TRINITY_DN3301_c0_g1_i2.p1 TRINITY_DN3301_c0_g1~~TRINITY_DN3301_c0_g1_i2.p1  ORF type:complete len:645 (-),score=135.76 TRINITY_DN3301_c0_g1_i2:287-2221(-)